MIPLNGYDETPAGIYFKKLNPGGYIAQIIDARVGALYDGSDGLAVEVDIIEGDCTGYFKAETERFNKGADGNWTSNGTLRIPIFENGKIHWRLKQFLENIKRDNPSIQIKSNAAFDERTLRGKICGIVVGIKESKSFKRDGTHYLNPYVSYTLPVDDIRAGNFSVPKLKTASPNIETNTPANDFDFGGNVIDPNDTPF